MTRLCKGMLVAAALTLSIGAAAAQTVTWQDHKVNPKGFWLTANEFTFAENLAKATDGKFKINVFPGGSAGFQGVEALDAVSENLLQVAEVWGGHVAGQEKVMELLDLPQFVPGDFEFRKKLWEALYPPFADYLGKRYNVVVLDYMQIQPRRLFSKAPIKSLADLKGLKIRAIGPADANFTQVLGAEATTTNWGELYVALQQGLVDGHWAADGAHAAMKFYEVTKYIYDTQNAGPSFFLMVNRKAFDALPADLRKAFLDGVADLKRMNRESYPNTEGKARQTLLAQGMQVTAVAEADQAQLRKVSGPIVEKWANELKPEARKIYDIARAMIDAHYAGK